MRDDTASCGNGDLDVPAPAGRRCEERWKTRARVNYRSMVDLVGERAMRVLIRTELVIKH